jgi:hypothetical protein
MGMYLRSADPRQTSAPFRCPDSLTEISEVPRVSMAHSQNAIELPRQRTQKCPLETRSRLADPLRT